MMSSVLITLLGLAAITVTGSAASRLLLPRQERLGAEVPGIGAAVLVAVSYPCFYFLRADVAVPLILGAVGVLILGALVVEKRRGRGPGTAFIPNGDLLWVLAFGGTAAIILLAPILQSNFPTTLAWTNNDAWSYASLIDWLQVHAATGTTFDASDPISAAGASVADKGYPIGMEAIGSVLAWITGLRGYQVLGSLLAGLAMVGISGWVVLARSVSLRAPSAIVAGCAFLATLSPMVVHTVAQTYGPQYLSLLFWPFIIGSVISVLRFPSLLSATCAALGLAAAVSVYPTLLLWLAPGIALLMAFAIASKPGGVHAAVPALGHLILAVAMSFMIAPVQWVAGIRNIVYLSNQTSNASFAGLSARDLAVSGLAGPSASGPLDTRGPLSALAVVIAIAAAGALLAAWRKHSAGQWLGIAAIAAVVPAAAIVMSTSYAYGEFKAAITGGALVCGCALMASLVLWESTRRRTLALLLPFLLALAWVPGVLKTLEGQAFGFTGYRAADVELGRAMKALPSGSTLLVEGAGESPAAFQARMMAAYWASSRPKQVDVIGLGTTSTYLSPGNDPAWTPRRPWNYVLEYSPAAGLGRLPAWGNSKYRLTRAPAQDVTPWGANWFQSEALEIGQVTWTRGSADLLLSNAATEPSQVKLTGGLVTAGQARLIRISKRGEILARVPVPLGQATPFSIPVDLPPLSVVKLTFSASPGRPSVVGADSRALVFGVLNVSLR